ncbi:NAD(P)-dependent oxidoreductase [Phytohabitans rumicis]|uniref:Flavin reductase n=1 Tax=Phytohabitans rumicis TaxID=1076125 RepID=A0A6V8LM38_9ACTN|nr:NAD(P)H-binding protein [Phytohabitans rumicis]GFJ93695.1 flavin reductase [Phytohabitans rumicis]
MKLAIFGATGRTGRPLLNQALAQGHTITALARDPGKLPTHANLHTVAGGIHDAEAVKQAIVGTDAVLFAAGQSLTAKTSVCTDAMRTIIPAMDASGVRRLVAISLYGTGDSRRTSPFVVISRLASGALVRDKEGMEALIAASDTDWTIFRPAVLKDAPHTGHYRTGHDLKLGFLSRMPYADLADAMLAQVTGAGHIRQAISITS